DAEPVLPGGGRVDAADPGRPRPEEASRQAGRRGEAVRTGRGRPGGRPRPGHPVVDRRGAGGARGRGPRAGGRGPAAAVGPVAGLSVEETGAALGVRRTTASGDWAYARAWLTAALTGE